MRPFRTMLFATAMIAAAASAEITVYHMTTAYPTGQNTTYPRLQLKNQGSSAVDLSKITVDYLIYEQNLQPSALIVVCDNLTGGPWTGNANNLFTREVSSIPEQTSGQKKANIRLRLGFMSGTLAAGQTIELQLRVYESSWQYKFNETDDLSYTSNNGQWNLASQVVVNGGGVSLPLIWTGEVATLPTTPAGSGAVVRSTTDDASYVYDGTKWVAMAVGKAGPKGDQGLQGPKGDKGDTGPMGPAGSTADVTELKAVVAAQGVTIAAQAEQLKQFQNSAAFNYGSPWNSTITYGSFTDSRDGNIYRTVTLGTQTWMAENLNYGGSNMLTGACYSGVDDNCSKYGRLYTWTEAMNAQLSSAASPSGVQGICPDGWHLPSDAEWTTMQTFVDPAGTTIGTKLKSTLGWNSSSAVHGSGTDDVGFRALPAGYYSVATDSFYSIKVSGGWWTATQKNATSYWYRLINNKKVTITRAGVSNYGFSVRCTKD